MLGTIGPDVARAAAALQRSHPQVPALEILDVCLGQRAGSVRDFAGAEEAGTPFALIIAEAFDPVMHHRLWLVASDPNADPAGIAALRAIWRDDVLPRFASRYGLTL